jgi:putative two-component system response regulator
MNSILVVDDDPSVRSVVRKWVQSLGYEANEAPDAQTALDVMDVQPPNVAVCDIRMPGHDGLWLTQQIRGRFPETAVVLATGAHDADVASRGAELGAVDYLLKPFGTDRLAAAVRRGVEWHREAADTRRWLAALDEMTAAGEQRLASLIQPDDDMDWTNEPALHDLGLDATALWGERAQDRIVGRRREIDPKGQAAAERVMRLAISTGVRLGMTEREIHELKTAALVHDLGKLALPDALRRKPAALTADESALMRRHPLIAHHVLRRAPALAQAADIVLASCEWFGGMGYPRGLVGEQIPLASRILAVAVAFQAMTAGRPYRDPMPTADAVLELLRCQETQFDPRVLDAFIRVITEH